MNKILLNGIYDLRTFKFLQSEGINNYSFDFNPRSSCFIQEYKFLEIIKTSNLSSNIFLRFKNNEDCFIDKIVADLAEIGLLPTNINFIFDEVTINIANFKYKFFIYYDLTSLKMSYSNINLLGIIFNQSFLDEIYNKNLITSFYNNLLFSLNANFQYKLILEIEWEDSIKSTINDLFDFDYYMLNINSSIEICYRNVNLIKLKEEIIILKNELF